MHYYKFNIKDWMQDTAHLSLEEECIYRRLIDFYYETERPIPTETQSVIRRLRLVSHEQAFRLVLEEFFSLQSDGYHHKRCDEELEKYHAKADANRKNGQLGGRPHKPTDNPDGCQEEPTDNLNHKPLTINQELRKEKKKPASNTRSSLSLQNWLSACKEAGEELFPEGCEAKNAASALGLPDDIRAAQWMRFKDYYTSTMPRKRYRDWRKAFANSIRGNWYRLWFLDQQGVLQITSNGRQAERELMAEIA